MALLYNTYTWGGHNWGKPAASGNNISYLAAMDDRISLLSDLHHYANKQQRVITGASGETLLWTDKYIYPLFMKPIMVLDGTIFGQLRYGLKRQSGSGTLSLSKIEITLKKIDNNGNETNLANTHTLSSIGWETDSISAIYKSFLFFFHVENQELKMLTNRIMFEVKPYGTVSGGDTVAHFFRSSNINTNEQSMIIPVV